MVSLLSLLHVFTLNILIFNLVFGDGVTILVHSLQTALDRPVLVSPPLVVVALSSLLQLDGVDELIGGMRAVSVLTFVLQAVLRFLRLLVEVNLVGSLVSVVLFAHEFTLVGVLYHVGLSIGWVVLVGLPPRIPSLSMLDGLLTLLIRLLLVELLHVGLVLIIFLIIIILRAYSLAHSLILHRTLALVDVWISRLLSSVVECILDLLPLVLRLSLLLLEDLLSLVVHLVLLRLT